MNFVKQETIVSCEKKRNVANVLSGQPVQSKPSQEQHQTHLSSNTSVQRKHNKPNQVVSVYLMKKTL